VTPIVGEEIPYAAAQGIFRARRESFPRQGKWLENDPLAATKHLLRIVALGAAQHWARPVIASLRSQ
jgi:hypothetical protein